MSGRWKVVKTNMGRWRAEALDVDEWMTFPTHAEALAHADQRSREVTVTLPRVGERAEIPYGESPSSLTLLQGRGDEISIETGGRLTILFPCEIEPIAIAMLAMHHRKEQA